MGRSRRQIREINTLIAQGKAIWKKNPIDFNAALVKFKRVFELDGNNVDALWYVAACHFYLGDNARAKETAFKAIGIKKDNGHAYAQLGFYFYTEGNYVEAIKYYEFAAQYIKHRVFLYHLALAYQKTGDIPKAYASMVESVKYNRVNEPYKDNIQQCDKLKTLAESSSSTDVSVNIKKTADQNWHVTFQTPTKETYSCSVKIGSPVALFADAFPINKATTSKADPTLLLSTASINTEMNTHKTLPESDREAAAIISLVWKNMSELHTAINKPEKRVVNLSPGIKPNAIKKTVLKSDATIINGDGIFFTRVTDFLDSQWLMGQYVRPVCNEGFVCEEIPHDNHLHEVLSSATDVENILHVVGANIPSVAKKILLSGEIYQRTQSAPQQASVVETAACAFVGTGAQVLVLRTGCVMLGATASASLALAPETGGDSLFAFPLLVGLTFELVKASKLLGDVAQKSCHDTFRLFDKVPSSLQTDLSLCPNGPTQKAESTFFIGKTSQFNLRKLARLPESAQQVKKHSDAKVVSKLNPQGCAKKLNEIRKQEQQKTVQSLFNQTPSSNKQSSVVSKPSIEQIKAVREKKEATHRAIDASTKSNMQIQPPGFFVQGGGSFTEVGKNMARDARDCGKSIRRTPKKTRRVVRKLTRIKL